MKIQHLKALRCANLVLKFSKLMLLVRIHIREKRKKNVALFFAVVKICQESSIYFL